LQFEQTTMTCDHRPTECECPKQKLRYLGHGATAAVYYVENPGTVNPDTTESTAGEKFAFKRYHTIPTGREDYRQEMKAQTLASKLVRTPKVFGIGEGGLGLGLKMEYIEAISLEKFSLGLGGVNLLKKLHGAWLQTEEALEKMHSHGLYHLDLTRSNLHIDNDDHVVFMDWGSAEMIDPDKRGKSVGGDWSEAWCTYYIRPLICFSAVYPSAHAIDMWIKTVQMYGSSAALSAMRTWVYSGARETPGVSRGVEHLDALRARVDSDLGGDMTKLMGTPPVMACMDKYAVAFEFLHAVAVLSSRFPAEIRRDAEALKLRDGMVKCMVEYMINAMEQVERDMTCLTPTEG